MSRYFVDIDINFIRFAIMTTELKFMIYWASFRHSESCNILSYLHLLIQSFHSIISVRCLSHVWGHIKKCDLLCACRELTFWELRVFFMVHRSLNFPPGLGPRAGKQSLLWGLWVGKLQLMLSDVINQKTWAKPNLNHLLSARSWVLVSPGKRDITLRSNFTELALGD